MLTNSGQEHNFILMTNSMKRDGDLWVFGDNVSDFPDYMPVNFFCGNFGTLQQHETFSDLWLFLL